MLIIGNSHWVGATDLAYDDVWRWRSDNALMSNGGVIVESGTSFAPGQPDACCAVAGDGEADCAFINYDSCRKIHDAGCTQVVKYICEHPSV